MNLAYLGKRCHIAPDSYGRPSWQLADENSAPTPTPLATATTAIISPLLLLTNSCGALEMPESLLFFHLTTQWKYKMPVSLAARERKRELVPPR